MRYISLCLFSILTISVLVASEPLLPTSQYFTVWLDECDNGDVFEVSYVDDDSSGVFDRLIINNCGSYYEEVLSDSMTVGHPPLDLYNHKDTWFEIDSVNYSSFHADAYFQVVVWYKDSMLGYWEHNMGGYKLVWKD